MKYIGNIFRIILLFFIYGTPILIVVFSICINWIMSDEQYYGFILLMPTVGVLVFGISFALAVATNKAIEKRKNKKK